MFAHCRDKKGVCDSQFLTLLFDDGTIKATLRFTVMLPTVHNKKGVLWQASPWTCCSMTHLLGKRSSFAVHMFAHCHGKKDVMLPTVVVRKVSCLPNVMVRKGVLWQPVLGLASRWVHLLGKCQECCRVPPPPPTYHPHPHLTRPMRHSDRKIWETYAILYLAAHWRTFQATASRVCLPCVPPLSVAGVFGNS